MHYHVTRHDYNTRTDQPMDIVGVGHPTETYAEAKDLIIQDEKQFRVPTAERWILHRWEVRPCSVGNHLRGPSVR